MEQLTFTCPRCSSSVAESYYGPCQTRRTAMRAVVEAVARDVEIGA